MNDILKAGGIGLLTGLMAGMMLAAMVLPRHREDALKIELNASGRARAIEAQGAAAPSAVTAADAATVIVENYGNCTETAARLSALQDWVRAQQMVMNGDRK